MPERVLDTSVGSVRVLVAEDDPVSRHRLHSALSSWGYEVTSVVDGHEALREIARPDPPQIAILDWSMPRIDGLQVCRAVRETAAGQYVYVILLTSHDRDDDVLEGFDAGADDYITKPFDPRQLKVKSPVRIDGASRWRSSWRTSITSSRSTISTDTSPATTSSARRQPVCVRRSAEVMRLAGTVARNSLRSRLVACWKMRSR